MKLSEKHIEVITRTAIEAYKEQIKSAEKTKHDRRLRNIKLLLRNYRSFKLHGAGINLEIKELDNLLEIESLDTDEFAIESIKRSKQRTLAMLKFIEKMMSVYKVLCDQSGKEDDRRIYQSVYQMYISDERLSSSEIATRQNTDPRTVYRDVDKACKTLSALIFGVDSIRFY
jgi:hypothetical protein